MKRYLSLLNAVLFVALLMATKVSEAAVDRVVAIVNSEVITSAELVSYMNVLKMQMGQERWDYFGMDSGKALEALIEDRLILQEAKRQGVKVEDRTINSHLDRIKSGFPDEDAFYDALSQQGLTLPELKERVREQMLRDAYVAQEIRSRIFIGPKEVTDYYEAHIDNYCLPERVEIDSIFVKDQAAANDVYAKLKDGQAFADLKERHSEKKTLSGTVKKGELRSEIDSVLFSLEEGNFSVPVKIDERGFFIFLVTKVCPLEEKKSLIEVQNQIRNELIEIKFQEKLNTLLKELKDKAHIVIKNA